MHFISLVAVEMPKIKENQAENQEVEKCLEELREAYKQNSKNIVLELQIERLSGLTTEFARALDHSVCEIMKPYDAGTEDPKYLEFDDRTEELEDAYFDGKTDCIRLPNGTILEATSYYFWDRFVISDGKVFQQYAGPLHHMKRTKKAKKMTVLPDYPRTKLFKTFEEYAEERGVPFDEQKERYGYWYNHNGMWDWYSIGGRWADMFLVKDTCTEFSPGERSWCNSEKDFVAPEGYRWVCAARKKDIDWQKMREWETQKRTEWFERLQRMVADNKPEEQFSGIVDEKGVRYYGEYIYYKGESLESFMKREAMPNEWKYPIYIHDIVDTDDWQSKDDIQVGAEQQKSWHMILDEYIDSLSDDTVLVGVDYHI